MPADSATRRLTTILAADIAGYSRLTGLDEEGTLARLRALRRELVDPAIAEHRGRIVKTAGDGLLVEFASVVDAVRCAMAVQRGMALRNADAAPQLRIEFRIGINLGDVVVESDGDLMGDGVNIAARLESIAEPGGICVSEAAYQQVRGKVEADFVDRGDQQLKNIATPVHVHAIGLNAAAATTSAVSASNQPATPAPRLSIVVLPFANLGGDKEQDYFVDGITESLTTDLSRISGCLVIARNTAFAYKGKPVGVKEIGRDLAVRYVLEGSVQRAGNRLRVNVQLIDAENGAHLWVERFDRDYGDLFEMQDEIVTRLARALDVQLVAAEARRSERSVSPDSMDLVFRARAIGHRGLDPATLADARRLFQQALALDPANIEALVGFANSTALAAGSFMTDERTSFLAEAEKAAKQALALAPDHAYAHAALGLIYAWSNRVPEAIAECEHAIAIDPNLTTAYASLSIAKILDGGAEETEPLIARAFRLSPRDVFASLWSWNVAGAKLLLGRDEEAVAWSRRAIESNRSYSIAHFFLAAALAHQGKIVEAARAVREGLALDPGFTIHRFRAGAATDNAAYLAQRERIYEGLRKAGVPEE